MPPAAHSPEFARLASAWLDETATEAEAARLWQAIGADPACALEFASLARFDALLSATVQELAGEGAVLRVLAASPALDAVAAGPTAERARRRRHVSGAPVLRLAAAFAVLGLFTAWLLRPAPRSVSVVDSAPSKSETITASPLAARPAPSRLLAALPPVPPATQSPQGVAEMPLPDRLDQFFLPPLDLNQMPLEKALGFIQGRLVELNFRNAETLNELRITIPSNAAGRRISFKSGPISFLKAARAIAALGGCDLTVDEASLALVLHREIYPQLPSKTDIRALLAGRESANGTAAESDPERLAALAADAAALGIPIDPNHSFDVQPQVPVTRGQWLALQALTDARDQLSRYPAPSFQLYLTESSPADADRVLDEEETAAVRQQFALAGIAPVSVISPSIAAVGGTLSQGGWSPVITAQPLGEATQITLAWSAPPSGHPDSAGPAPVVGHTSAIVLTNQGLTLRGSASAGPGISIPSAFPGMSGIVSRTHAMFDSSLVHATLIPNNPTTPNP